MIRIYFDTNDRTEDGNYALNLNQSKRDIEQSEEKLVGGQKIIIYMTDELECEAILEFDEKMQCWSAKPLEGTYKYLDKE